MQLKEFQHRTLDALTEYFRACTSLNNANMAFYQTTLNRYGLGISFTPVKELPDLPYVCLRLPTGGEKTFVAAHSVTIAAGSTCTTIPRWCCGWCRLIPSASKP